MSLPSPQDPLMTPPPPPEILEPGTDEASAPPPYTPPLEPPPAYKPIARCPFLRGPSPGRPFSLLDAVMAPISWEHLAYHFLFFFLFFTCFILAMWLAFFETQPRSTTLTRASQPLSATPLPSPFTPHPRFRRASKDHCQTCISTVWEGARQKKTLLYQSHHTCRGATVSCSFLNLTYSYCLSSSKCFNPKPNPVQQWVRLKKGSKEIQRVRLWPNHPLIFSNDFCKLAAWPLSCGTDLSWHRRYALNDLYACPRNQLWRLGIGMKCRGTADAYCHQWSCVAWATWKTDHKDLFLTKVPTPLNCSAYSCTTFNIVIPDWHKFKAKWAATTSSSDVTIGIRIEAKNTDPGAVVTFEQFEYREAEHPLHLSYYQEFWTEMAKPFHIPDLARNLFIQLAEVVAGTLNVTNCFVCGGTNVGDQWPWEASAWDMSLFYNASGRPPHSNDSVWELRDKPVFDFCIFRWQAGTPIVGESLCNQMLTLNLSSISLQAYNLSAGTTLPAGWPNDTHAEKLGWPKGLASAINATARYSGSWPAPAGLYWICGRRAYSVLPAGWTGSCALGDIRPSFFLIPLSDGQNLAHPLFTSRVRRSASGWDSMKIGDWDSKWPPERIIAYYGPATWAQDGSYGYRTPIYMLNRIIRLQAIVELLTRENKAALVLLSRTQTQLRNAVYQNRLALDYLLAAEGGVCGKFNLTDCCLQIDDNGKVIEEITDRMIKLAHVPVQQWTGLLDEGGVLGGIFNNWKQALFMFAIIVVGLMMLPCLIPLLRSIIQSVVDAAVRKQAMTITLPEYPMLFEQKVAPLLNCSNDEEAP